MFRWWRNAVQLVKRDTLLRGSPAYRWGVWVSGIAGGLLWIWDTEKKAPIEERRIFLPAKREVVMNPEQILEWNKALSGGKLLTAPSQEFPSPESVPDGETTKPSVERTKWQSLGASLLSSLCPTEMRNGAAEKGPAPSLSVLQDGEGRERVNAHANYGDTDGGRHTRKLHFFGELR